MPSPLQPRVPRRGAPKRHTRTLEAKLSRISVLVSDARDFMKGHKPKPAFRRELDAYTEAMLRLAEVAHERITGGL